ncbi:MBL fold metallo-hydrolase [Thioclava sp. GXIMD4215]|uniref:MBL fold metallo-hydrolase n=1 Tax=Thioclava sp. GXIMD4215 TaxID=3131928 RepID=UPI003251F6A3
MPCSDENNGTTGAYGIRHVLAPNPSPMTQNGTNSYLLGQGDVAVIDPGPLDEAHLAAILAALGPDERITHILVTHAHLDHSAGARALAAKTGAATYGFGAPQAGRSALMQRLAEEGQLGGGEGIDHDFLPDHNLADGAQITVGGARITAHHTPGHFSNHLSFEFGTTVFSGDVVMGWTSTVISPPDGDLASYFAALDRLESLAPHQLLAGHGAPILAPRKRIGQLRAHRLARHAQITEATHADPVCATTLARQIYGDLPPRILQAATRNCLAHLIDMMEKDELSVAGPITDQAIFQRR